jgi:hypothetical protein
MTGTSSAGSFQLYRHHWVLNRGHITQERPPLSHHPPRHAERASRGVTVSTQMALI